MSKVRVDVDIDFDDLVWSMSEGELGKSLRDALDYEQRLKLAKHILRDPLPSEVPVDELKSFVGEAIELLRSGRNEDALLVLERSAFPKWASQEASLLALKAIQ